MVPVLIIEDLAPTGVFPSILRRQGYPTFQISSFQEPSPSSAPGVVVFRTGTSITRATRALPSIRARWPKAAIVVLAETAREADALAVLAAGADDFHPIPIALGEFLVRLRRHAERHLVPESVQILGYGRSALSVLERELSSGERTTKLTPLEAELLAVLMRANGAPVERSALAASVHQAVGKACSPRTIDSHISHLRTKLRKGQLGLTVYSVYGEGYRIVKVG